MNEVEEKVAKQLEYERGLKDRDYATQTVGGAALGQCGRPNLRERISGQLYRATEAANERERLAELEYLLSKHPEIARILDLLEDVKY